MKIIVKKILTLIITMLVISFLTFAAFSLLPGDAALSKLGMDATEEQIEDLRREMDLDGSVPERYSRWLRKALKGDFGESLQYDGWQVSQLITSRLPITLCISALSLCLIVLISIPLAILSVRFEGSVYDKIVENLGTVTMAIPSFVLGILLTYLFGLLLRWFQPGMEVDLKNDFWKSIWYLVFPAISVSLPRIAMTARFISTSLTDEMNQDYVRTARGKGIRESMVLSRHVMPNSLIPTITFVALMLAEILGGSIIAEQVFSLNGMGRLMISSILSRDYPTVQACVLYVTAAIVVLNTLVDILYSLADPRVRVE